MRKFAFPASLLLCSLLTTKAADPALTFAGSGTQADPYLLTSAADVIDLADKTNSVVGKNGGTHYAGIYFKLTADVDLSAYTTFSGIGAAPDNTVASSKVNYYFAGNIDGDGHTISGMTINGVLFDANGTALSSGKDKSRDYCAFIGYLAEGGSLSNINFAADCSAAGMRYVAIAVGGAANATSITNVTTRGRVESYNGYAAGVVGEAVSAKSKFTHITSCVNYATVSSCADYVGGIAGSGNAFFKDCVNVGYITANSWNAFKTGGAQSYAGGIAGRTAGNATNYLLTIDNCVNLGNVYASKQYAGGLFGSLEIADMTDCANYGAVKAGLSIAGGIAGKLVAGSSKGSATRCLSAGPVSSPSSALLGAITGTVGTSAKTLATISDVIYDCQLANTIANNGETQYGTPMLTSALTGGNVPSLTGWNVAADSYPVPALGVNVNDVATAAAMYFVLPDGETTAAFDTRATLSPLTGMTAILAKEGNFRVSGNEILAPTGDIISKNTLTLAAGLSRDYAIQRIPATIFGTGSGTTDDPYIMTTPNHLINLAQMCNDTYHYDNVHFALGNDIDMTGIDFPGIATVATNQNSYKDYYFSGTLDGQGHTIKGLSIKRVAFGENGEALAYPASACSVALIGSANGATIKNLTLDSPVVEGYWYAAGLVGYSVSTIVSNCNVVNGDIKAYRVYAGGIVADMDKQSAISDCAMSGRVWGADDNVGGITGYLSGGSVTRCTNTASVIGEPYYYGEGEKQVNDVEYVGGIVGHGFGEIIDCFNAGSVHGGLNVGGLVGSYSTTSRKPVDNNVNIGRVTAADLTKAGAIVGDMLVLSTATDQYFHNNYYDSQLAGVRPTATGEFLGIEGLSTAEFTSGEALEGLMPENWTFTAGRYPAPAAATNADVALATAIYFTLPASASVDNMNGPGTIATVMPLTAELAGTEAFAIENGMIVPKPVHEVTTDLLTITNGNFAMTFRLTALPTLLEGSGTQDDP